jgi:hypothetical protein
MRVDALRRGPSSRRGVAISSFGEHPEGRWPSLPGDRRKVAAQLPQQREVPAVRYSTSHRRSRAGALAGLFTLLLALSFAVVNPAPAGAIAGPYHLKFRHSGKCVDNFRGLPDHNNIIQQWDCVAGNGSQKWYFEWTVNGYARIRNNDTHGCLTVNDAGSANGQKIVQAAWDDCGGTSREWKGTLISGDPNNPRDTDYDQMRNRFSGKCIDVPHSSRANGVQLQWWDCVAGNRQQHLTWY